MNNEQRIIEELGWLRKEVQRLSRVEVPLSGGGVTDHGALTGLLDNDQPQYSQTTHDHAGTYLPIAGKAADSDDFGRPVFLTTPLTSTDWDGDAYSTTLKTKIDLSSVFSVPAGVRAVLVQLLARDSGSAASTTIFFGISPNNTDASNPVMAVGRGLPNDTLVYVSGVCPCDANGDIYYQIVASGVGTMDCYIRIWGYWL